MIPKPDFEQQRVPNFAASAWGCMKGKVVLDGKEYGVTLEDQNINGVFRDFESKNGRDGDNLLLSQEGDQKTISRIIPLGSPLRKKMIWKGKVYSVAFKNNGQILVLKTVEINFGVVAVRADDVTAVFFNPEWGHQFMAPGEELALPIGTWTVLIYVRSIQDPMVICSYMAPPNKIQAEIKTGRKVMLDLDIQFEARVLSKIKGDEIQLDLLLCTAQGAMFSRYYSFKKMMKGIPFKILDEADRTVHNGYRRVHVSRSFGSQTGGSNRPEYGRSLECAFSP